MCMSRPNIPKPVPVQEAKAPDTATIQDAARRRQMMPPSSLLTGGGMAAPTGRSTLLGQ
jgi:hypothetical protein